MQADGEDWVLEGITSQRDNRYICFPASAVAFLEN